MTSDEEDLKIKIDYFDETNNFYVECFLIQWHLHGRIARAKQMVTHATHQTPCLMGRATFATWHGHAQVAVNFTYSLVLIQFLYRNQSFHRDRDSSCRSVFHMRPSWGRNQLNNALDTKSQYFEHNFDLRNEIGWLSTKYQTFSFWRYITFSLWALFHLRIS